MNFNILTKLSVCLRLTISPTKMCLPPIVAIGEKYKGSSNHLLASNISLLLELHLRKQLVAKTYPMYISLKTGYLLRSLAVLGVPRHFLRMVDGLFT